MPIISPGIPKIIYERETKNKDESKNKGEGSYSKKWEINDSVERLS